MLDFWQAFDLDTRRMQLDKQGLEMQDAREASQKSKKRLMEQTKEFRRMTDSQKLASTKDILKGYQAEIDSLTKRAKYSDNAFLALYKALYEAPDPAKALVNSMTARPRAAQSELEVIKLRKELSAYEQEFKDLKNQEVGVGSV